MLKHPRKVSKEFNIGYGFVMLVSIACMLKNPHDWWLPLYVLVAYVLSLWVMGKRDKVRKDKERAKNLARGFAEPNTQPSVLYRQYVIDPNSIYPMGKAQPAQIDCRMVDCKYHKNASCTNPAPAITLNESGKFVCWSKNYDKEKT